MTTFRGEMVALRRPVAEVGQHIRPAGVPHGLENVLTESYVCLRPTLVGTFPRA